MAGALPEVVVIGGMKCGTSALHRYLDHHPQVAMSEPKELNFFFGPDSIPEGCEPWQVGARSLGLDWYASHFDAGAEVRGESSPGYTSPARPEVAERMAAVLPDARLIYCARDPVERAISQYRHHRREGTEPRPMAEALLHPSSQYLSRSRHAERLAPFLACFDRSQILVVVTEELLERRRDTLRRVYGFLGVDEGFWSDALERRWHLGDASGEEAGPALRAEVAAALRADADRLRALIDHPLDRWSV